MNLCTRAGEGCSRLDKVGQKRMHKEILDNTVYGALASKWDLPLIALAGYCSSHVDDKILISMNGSL